MVVVLVWSGEKGAENVKGVEYEEEDEEEKKKQVAKILKWV